MPFLRKLKSPFPFIAAYKPTWNLWFFPSLKINYFHWQIIAIPSFVMVCKGKFYSWFVVFILYLNWSLCVSLFFCIFDSYLKDSLYTAIASKLCKANEQEKCGKKWFGKLITILETVLFWRILMSPGTQRPPEWMTKKKVIVSTTAADLCKK